MFNKKGDFAFGIPFYLSLAFVFFILIIVIFSILFFAIGIKQNQNLIIKSESYQDSSKILALLQTKTNIEKDNINLTLAEAISLASENESHKQQLTDEIKKLLNNLPQPGIKQDYWNLDIKINNIEFLHVGEKVLTARNYFVQKVNIPLKSKEIAEAILYLNCLLCTKEDLENYA